jgi:hypothetical protein
MKRRDVTYRADYLLPIVTRADEVTENEKRYVARM